MNPKAADCNTEVQFQTADVHKHKFVLELIIRDMFKREMCRVSPDVSEVFHAHINNYTAIQWPYC